MKMPMEWLSDYVKISTDPKHYCDVMTDTGSKVEGYELLGDGIRNVHVGRVLSIAGHPDADRLVVCSVDVGETEPIQIVTAATNVVVGALVPVALHKSTLADGTQIKSGKLRGVLSQGMFCSIAELGLTLHDMPYAAEDGILLLREECKPGDDICDVLRLRDTVVEFEITPNRPDCLSMIGLARETGVSFETPCVIPAPSVKGSGDSVDKYLSVSVQAPELCPRYTARVVKNVKIAPSPLWMRARLRAAGVRPINNIVDITNYVMLEYGQPMHAFDYSYLSESRIVVRKAEAGEHITTLDGKDCTLRAGMLVIADSKKPVALAGIMGGANSEISDTTSAVVFESACFNGPSVRITSRALGVRTESSGRFEKGLDRENAFPALERACELVELLGAGDVVDGVIDEYPGKLPQTVLKLRPDKINALLGTSLDAKYMTDVLTRLHFDVRGDDIYVPSFRGDVERTADIAEEIARIYGYNKIISAPILAPVVSGGLSPRQKFLRTLNGTLNSMGLYEIYTYSFISPKAYEKLRLPAEKRRSVVISNPLGEDTSVMRTTALSGMLEVMARNYNFRTPSGAFYEEAKTYLPSDEPDTLPEERIIFTAGFYGTGDFYRMSGIVAKLLEVSGITEFDIEAVRDDPSYHPGRCAKYTVGGKTVAFAGQLHPEVCAAYGLDCDAYAAEIDFETLDSLKNTERVYTPLPKYPAVTRDFAFICDRELESESLLRVIKKAGGKYVEKISVFDVYEGAQLPAGKKSIAYTVSLRAPDKTLTVEDADKISAAVIAEAESAFGAKLR